MHDFGLGWGITPPPTHSKFPPQLFDVHAALLGWPPGVPHQELAPPVPLTRHKVPPSFPLGLPMQVAFEEQDC